MPGLVCLTELLGSHLPYAVWFPVASTRAMNNYEYYYMSNSFIPFRYLDVVALPKLFTHRSNNECLENLRVFRMVKNIFACFHCSRYITFVHLSKNIELLVV